MALFNTEMPTSQVAPRKRNFSGNGWAKTKLALSGSKADGSSNWWGKGVTAALPVVAGLVSTYFTGNYQLGSTLGKAATKGLDNWTENQLGGTDTLAVAQEDNANLQALGGKLDAIGSFGASAYQAFGGKTKADKKEVAGLATLDQIKENTAASTQFDPAKVNPASALSKFFGGEDSPTTKGLDALRGMPSANEPYAAGQQLNLGGTQSSVTGMFDQDFRMLDMKRKQQLDPYGQGSPYFIGPTY